MKVIYQTLSGKIQLDQRLSSSDVDRLAEYMETYYGISVFSKDSQPFSILEFSFENSKGCSFDDVEGFFSNGIKSYKKFF